MIVAEPKARWHLREIARKVGTSAGTASRELQRLADAGLVDRQAEGRQVYFGARVGSPLIAPVRRILAATVEPNPQDRRPDPLGTLIARRLAAQLSSAYPGRVRGAYLYGSRARGEDGPESDVDVLIVLDELRDYGEDLRLSSELASDLSLEHGVTITRTLLSEREWVARDRPFVRAIAADAIAV
jgi:predicted nucleotidyltransferase